MEAESEDLSKAGLPAALFGGLARHLSAIRVADPCGGLKDSACPPEFNRHSCGGCGGLILCHLSAVALAKVESVSKKGSESLVFSFGAEGRIRVKPVSVGQYLCQSASSLF